MSETLTTIQQQISHMQEQVQLAEAGFEAFRKGFARTNPPPRRKPYKNRLGLIRAALVIIMIASSVVSASHTIPTFANAQDTAIYEINFLVLLVGVAAFFMSELALATFAYVGVMRHYRETGREPKSLKNLVSLGVIVPFLVMAAANINHQFHISGVVLPDFIVGGILLAISLSAPFMGYISGEVFAMYEVVDRVDEEKHEAAQDDAQERWEEKARAAWGRVKGDYGGKIKIEPVPVQALPSIPVSAASGTDGHGQERTDRHGYGTGYTKRMDARDIIRTHLQEHPEDLSMTVRELADKLGRSKTTVAEVMKELRS